MTRFTVLVVSVVLAFLVSAPVPEVTAKKYLVGDKQFWNPNISYTNWVRGKHFYPGDYLYFVYYRYQHNILEVNKADYESCNADHFIKNYSRGAGRDIVPLYETRPYYLLDGRGGCSSGMKLTVTVENPPPPPPPISAPPPKSAPVKSIGTEM